MFITIPNWAKYNPRCDVISWYRVNADILDDPKFVELIPTDWVVLLYILGQCSRGKGSFKLIEPHAERATGHSKKDFFDALYRIRSHGFCQVTEDAPIPIDPTDGRTDERTEGFVCDAEAIYTLYPKRDGDQGKKLGLERIKRQIKNEQMYEQLKRAVCNYASHCQAQGIVNTRFVKQFRTFMSVWTEWVDRDPPLTSPAALQKWVDLK